MPRVDIDAEHWFDLFEPTRIPRTRATAYRHSYYKMIAASAKNVDLSASEEESAAAIGQDTEALLGALEGKEALDEALVLACVASWSWGEVTHAAFDQMTQDEFEAVRGACLSGGYEEKIAPDFSVNPDEDSPTKPS